MNLTDEYKTSYLKIFIAILLVIIFFEFYSIFISPHVYVWKQKMLGQAELSRAESNKQIATLEALAKKESAKSLAEAEIIRAKGVAEANKIIGDSLNENESYLKYLYITHLGDTNDKTVIYVPTEAMLPVLESTRLLK